MKTYFFSDVCVWCGVCVRERGCVCVCVCERERREREREVVCVYFVCKKMQNVLL